MARYELKDAGFSVIADSGKDPIPRIVYSPQRNTLPFPDEARDRVKRMLERLQKYGDSMFALYGIDLP